MKKLKNNSRRNFVKTSLTIVGTATVCNPLVVGKSSNTIIEPDQIPLNDVLVDVQQINAKYGHGLKRVEVQQVDHWKSKQKSIVHRAKVMMGEPPTVESNLGEVKILKKVHRAGYDELKIQFSSGTNDLIKGYLLIPHNIDNMSPRPAIMALHSTGPGATQAVGLTPKEGRTYGMDLARRGYVVLAIDVISAGERVYPGYEPYYTNEFYNEFPNWSAMGKMVQDHKKGLDYLCSLDFVDSNRLGCIGHSLGGYNSFFLHAFDHRIKAAIVSCGLSPMGGSNSPYQFARDDWFIHFNPGCREFIRSGMIPCDMHEFMALGAPRPLFNYSAKQDSIYSPENYLGSKGFDGWWQTVDASLDQVSKVYDLMGASDHFMRVEKDGDHDFPLEVRTQAYSWLDNILGMA